MVSRYDLVALLEDHVEIVDHQAIADFALRHHNLKAAQGGGTGNHLPLGAATGNLHD